MIINKSNRFNETQVIEVLDNGLTVSIISKPEFRSNAAVLGTPFGAKNLFQVIDGTKTSYNAGVAHFLEHKLFEQEETDILSVFTNLGASANAFTSYDETMYYFSNVDDIEKPLNILLDFVQELSISEESVEKEKGIILEELGMYDQMPMFKLTMELIKSMYHKHPVNQDILGSKESINAISKEELDSVYRVNYHPSQMVLSIVTHVDVDTVLNLIRDNQAKKSFGPNLVVKNDIVDEPKEVKTPFKELSMNLNIPKVALGYKQSVPFVSMRESIKLSVMTRFLLEMTFSNLNPQYQTFLDDGLINDFFHFQSNYGPDYGFVEFVGETSDVNKWLEFVRNQLADLAIDESLLQQLKRRNLGETLSELSDFDGFAMASARSIFYDIELFDLLTLVETITLEDLQNTKKLLDTTHESVVVIK